MMIEKNEELLVYSTEKGRIVQPKEEVIPIKGDGIVRIQRQVSGRRGKGVSVITGLMLVESELIQVATALKKHCGCGGCVKNGTIEIQGDKRDSIKRWLENKGYRVKLSGG